MTHYFSSGEDDGQAEGRDDDARREEDGELFAGVAGRVCVIDHPPRDAVRDGWQDVEEEEEQRPVFTAESQKGKIKNSNVHKGCWEVKLFNAQFNFLNTFQRHSYLYLFSFVCTVRLFSPEK